MMLRPSGSEWRTDLPKLRCALLALSLTAMHGCTMLLLRTVPTCKLKSWMHIAMHHASPRGYKRVTQLCAPRFGDCLHSRFSIMTAIVQFEVHEALTSSRTDHDSETYMDL